MGLEKVIAKVKQDGDETVKGIIAQAKQQAAATVDQAQAAIKELAVKRELERDRQIAALRIQERNSLEIETRKIRLNAEKDVLAATYADCLAALQTLPHDKVIASLLQRASRELPSAATVSSNARDEPSVRSQTKLAYVEPIGCLGGIIVENADHTMKLDLRYETLAATVWDQHLKVIADVLFKKP